MLNNSLVEVTGWVHLNTTCFYNCDHGKWRTDKGWRNPAEDGVANITCGELPHAVAMGLR